jgi:hypothetical protein
MTEGWNVLIDLHPSVFLCSLLPFFSFGAARWLLLGGFDLPLVKVELAIDAVGVDPQKDLDRVAGPLGDLGRRDARVQPPGQATVRAVGHRVEHDRYLGAARLTQKRRKTRDSKGSGEDRPVTGRLADLEAMIDLEQHWLTEHAAPESATENMVVPDQGGPELPVGANRTRPVDLTDLAVPRWASPDQATRRRYARP